MFKAISVLIGLPHNSTKQPIKIIDNLKWLDVLGFIFLADKSLNLQLQFSSGLGSQPNLG